MGNKLRILGHYLVYKNRKFRTREQVEQYQQKKLKKQLEFVTTHSVFYQDYAGKALEEYPLMDKKNMMENFNQLNTVGIDRDEALKFAIEGERTREFDERLHGVTIGLSSGTSHSRGIFLVADKEQDQWAGYVLAKFLPRSILSPCKIAFFMRADSKLYQSMGSDKIQFIFFDIYKNMDENIQKLQESGADLLVAQPSVLLGLAKAVKEGRLNISPKKVISIAEVLEEQDAAYIRECFGVPVIHQVYQCTEGCLATTCEYGTIHLNEDIVHFDKEYLDDRRFIPILTDFTRTSQPMIRYRMNDVLVEKKEPCSCGCAFTALEKIEGREDDVFQFIRTDGTVEKIFPDFIRRCILFAGEITEYRVVQQEDGSITIYADLTDALKEHVREEFLLMLKEHQCNLVDVTFEKYTVKSGVKLKRVESLYRIS